MKYLKILSFFAFVVIAIMSCSTQKDTAKASSSDSIYQKWMLVDYGGFKKDELTKLNAYIDFTKQPDNAGRYSAFAGCNRMNFSAKFPKAGQMEISQPMSTMMFCNDAMALEDKMSKDLTKLTQYKIDGHFLTLSDASGSVKIKLVAAAWD